LQEGFIIRLHKFLSYHTAHAIIRLNCTTSKTLCRVPKGIAPTYKHRYRH